MEFVLHHFAVIQFSSLFISFVVRACALACICVPTYKHLTFSMHLFRELTRHPVLSIADLLEANWLLSPSLLLHPTHPYHDLRRPQ